MSEDGHKVIKNYTYILNYVIRTSTIEKTFFSHETVISETFYLWYALGSKATEHPESSYKLIS